MQYQLIQVHLPCERPVVCDCCDAASVYTKIYYRIKDPEDGFQFTRRYLDCCKNKKGTVVDWELETAYNIN